MDKLTAAQTIDTFMTNTHTLFPIIDSVLSNTLNTKKSVLERQKIERCTRWTFLALGFLIFYRTVGERQEVMEQESEGNGLQAGT